MKNNLFIHMTERESERKRQKKKVRERDRERKSFDPHFSERVEWEDGEADREVNGRNMLWIKHNQ